ncbi:MAG TPA: hypothetical protein PKM25_18740, partial [Candidatus Ozemobacteraceae bacterium]|nr:hypothetical protein [Candidatus Ozemobacteraceae bacterium]
EAAEALLREVESSPAARVRLEESLERIGAARSRLETSTPPASLENLARSHAAVIREAHDRAVLFDRAAPGDLPIPPETPLVIACPHIASLVQVEEEHLDAGPAHQLQQTFTHARCILYQPKAGREAIIAPVREALSAAGPTARLLLLSYNAHLFPDQEQALKALAADRPGTVLAALRNPYDLAVIPEASTAVATFGFRSPDIQSLISVLSGKITPSSGDWPVRLR